MPSDDESALENSSSQDSDDSGNSSSQSASPITQSNIIAEGWWCATCGAESDDRPAQDSLQQHLEEEHDF